MPSIAKTMANNLSQEKSLYLRQHANNPVNWWPWCSEAFERAQEEGKPILLSIGYSACHWCHVMERECFEDDYIAGLMNKYFVCIKVDREERPDIDQIYMEAVQMVTQQSGWPLNVFCLPDGRPFFGGTYFPPEDKGQGIVPWPQLLMRIATHYDKKREELEENADNILKNLQIEPNLDKGPKTIDDKTLFINAAQFICTLHDDDWGGFGQAPKFPPVSILEFLLSIRASRACEYEHPELAQRIDSVVNTTLTTMAHGGIFDQLGGGFMRYSVDRYWLIPHFEKMLYDNALLLGVYTKAWLRYKDPLFKAIVEETVSFLEREMLQEDGLFASSIDADTENTEGSYYIWPPEEVKAVLGEEEGDLFCYHYNITQEGNFEEGSSNPAWATRSFEDREKLKPLRDKLLKARTQRTTPACDTKKLLSWNSLLIESLAEAGFAFERKDWLERACRAADCIEKKMQEAPLRYHTVLYENEALYSANLDGYAFYAKACLSLASKGDYLKPGLGKLYLERASSIAKTLLSHFGDSSGCGFFFTADDREALIVRKKAFWDNATPSGNSVLVHVFGDLYQLTGEALYLETLQQLKGFFAPQLPQTPQGISFALSGLVYDAVGCAVLRLKNKDDFVVAQKHLSSRPYRKVFLSLSKTETPQLCIGKQCISDTEDIQKLLSFL
tara:strand:- start:7510 stop:9522 length:2013 start_codon:yes stop_codon:yes gene_type:complete